MNNNEMRVHELMRTELLTLEVDEHLNTASDLMDLGRVRHMPVLSHGRLVGIVTQRDLFRAALSSVLGLRKATEREWLTKIPVAEVMTKDVITARPDWTVRQAVDLMLERRVGCLPVVDGEHLVGLLSETDCLRLLGRLLSPPGTPAGTAPA
jgi:CBS domain-containing membrane protein